MDLRKVTSIIKNICNTFLDFKCKRFYMLIKKEIGKVYRKAKTEIRKPIVQEAMEVHFDRFCGWQGSWTCSLTFPKAEMNSQRIMNITEHYFCRGKLLVIALLWKEKKEDRNASTKTGETPKVTGGALFIYSLTEREREKGGGLFSKPNELYKIIFFHKTM